MIEFVELRTKTYRYLIDGGSENEKAKAPKIVSKNHSHLEIINPV